MLSFKESLTSARRWPCWYRQDCEARLPSILHSDSINLSALAWRSLLGVSWARVHLNDARSYSLVAEPMNHSLASTRGLLLVSLDVEHVANESGLDRPAEARLSTPTQSSEDWECLPRCISIDRKPVVEAGQRCLYLLRLYCFRVALAPRLWQV